MNNIARLQSAVADASFDALIITSPFNRRYATGFPSSAGVVLVTAAKAWFFTDSRYYEAASRAVRGAVVRQIEGENTYVKLINAVCAEREIGSLGFEDGSLTFAEYKTWSEKLTAELVPAQKVFDEARMVKSKDDIEKMIAAQRISERAFADILTIISERITERELAAELIRAFYKHGADDKSFAPIVVSGTRSSMPHGVPSDNKLKSGFLTIDFGVIKDGWCSDTTRTLCIGRATDEMRTVYDTVLEAQLSGIAAARAGVRGRDIDEAARAVIRRAGYGEYFGHGFGHGLGLEVHEAPSASPSYNGIIPVGAVISAEPGIYLPGKFGVRIEDVIVITENGCENITTLPKDLIEI